jgi:dolichyl-phosphate-mannose-protein mannosyltransferase
LGDLDQHSNASGRVTSSPIARQRPSATSRTQRERWLVLAIAALAALLRLAWVWAAISHVGVKAIYGGFEVTFVGAALAGGHGFSNLYGPPSGPTTSIAPIYPLIVAFAFFCFHAFSAQAAWFLFALNIGCEVVNVLLLYWIGRRCFGQMTAFAAALLWAIDPDMILYAVRIWYSSLSALLVLASIAAYLHLLERPPRRREGIAYGLFWAIAALTNTALILLMPAAVAGLFYRWRSQLWRAAVAGLLVFLAALVPWTVRNYIVFHKVIPIRGNFGALLWYGNRPDVKGPKDESLNPTQNPHELQAYLRLGDIPYAASRQQMALAVIRTNPGRFLRLTRDRILFFWAAAGPDADRMSIAAGCWSILAFAGLLLMVRSDWLRALTFAPALLLYPTPYYVTLASTFFRYPINPLVTLLAIHFCVTLGKRLGLLAPSASS